MKLYLVIFIIIFSGCLAKPKQPELTTKEKELIRTIMLRMNADTVYRELYPNSRDVSLKTGEAGYYALNIHISCSMLNKKDSLKNIAKKLAQDIKSLLTDDFKYSFNNKWSNIYISFTCSPIKGYEKSEFFEFKY